MHPVPVKFSKWINGYEWERITIGMSGAKTFLLKGNPNYYLKIQRQHIGEPLRMEKDKLDWLQGKLEVPEVVYYEDDGEYEYLLMTELKGNDASDPIHRSNFDQVVKLLAQGLRKIHSISIDDCPFEQTLNVKLTEAHKRVEQNLVDESDFDEVRKGMKADKLFQELIDNRPHEEDLVFTHGDYCLPNIIIHQGSVSGFIDVGRAGVADRYQDLALAVRSLEYNYGKGYQFIFLKEYGLIDADDKKIYYYQLLDEFL